MLLDDHQQLDGVAHLVSKTEIAGGHTLNAVYGNAVRGNRCTIGQHSQNQSLVGSIPAIDIQRGVSLGKALGLCTGKRRLERHALAFHGGKNVVTRAVDDTGNTLYIIADKRILQALNNRDTTAAGCLEVQRNTLLSRKLEQLTAVLREQSLITCYHRLTGLQSTGHQLVCFSRATNQLDDDVDFRIVHQLAPVIRQHVRGNHHVAHAAHVAHRDFFHGVAHLGAGLKQFVITAQRLKHTRAHCSKPCKAKLKRFSCHLRAQFYTNSHHISSQYSTSVRNMADLSPRHLNPRQSVRHGGAMQLSR